MTTEERIERESDEVAEEYLTNRHRIKQAYIAGAKSERNKTIDEAVVLLVKRGIPEADYNGKIVLDTLRSLKVNP